MQAWRSGNSCSKVNSAFASQCLHFVKLLDVYAILLQFPDELDVSSTKWLEFPNGGAVPLSTPLSRC